MAAVQSYIAPVGHASGQVKKLVVADGVGALRDGVHLTCAPKTVWNTPDFFPFPTFRRFNTNGQSFPEGYIIHTASISVPVAGAILVLPDGPLMNAAHPNVPPGGGFMCWLCNEYDQLLTMVDSVDGLVTIDPIVVNITNGQSVQLLFQRLLRKDAWTVRIM